MATKTWIGAAADVAQVTTLTVAGTWAAGDDLTISVGNRDLTITLGSGWSSTTANIAAEIAAALVAESRRAGVGTDYSWSAGGREYGEFLELIAVTVSGSVVTVQGPPGVPVTIAESVTTAGDGDITASTTTSATGKHFWSNADNWAEGSVPADGDEIVIGDTNVSIRYGLPGSTFAPGSVAIEASFTGHLGLPKINRMTAKSYYEYRTQAPSFGDDGSSQNNPVIRVGVGNGPGSSFIKIGGTGGIMSSSPTWNVIKTAPPDPRISEYSCILSWDGASSGGADALITGGSVVLEDAEITNIYVHDSTGETNLYVADSSTVVGTGTLEVLGGRVTWGAVDGFACTVFNGSLVIEGAAPAGLSVYGGTVEVIDPGEGSTVSSVTVSGGGVLDLRRCTKDLTFTSTTIVNGAQLLDSLSRVTYTNGIDLYQCGLADVAIDWGPHRTLSVSAI